MTACIDMPSREEARFAAMCRDSAPLVRRMCARLVDPQTADDLAQETLVRAWRSWSGFEGDGAAQTTAWLSTIARRVCAEEIHRRQRSRGLTMRLQSRARAADGSRSGDPMAIVDLVEACRALPSERLTAFLLTAVAGLSYAEAAELCDCAVGTIRSRVARAREQLVADLTGPADPCSESVA